MAICNHLAPNGEKSLLYSVLEREFGSDRAHDLWTASKTQQFLNKYQSYPKDINGEPIAAWVNAQLQSKSSFQPKNLEQANTITSIQNFLNTGNPKEYITVSGKAGTGKTTIVQEAIAPAIERGDKVLITALSHKAKLVLQNKLEERFGKGSVDAKSVAGALGMNMDLETGKFSADGDRFNEPAIAKAKVIIVDEASMINEEALSLIMSEKQPDAKVIFLGDIGQLPPIRENSTNTGPSPVFTKATQTFKLLERVRQGEESPILPYADKFWDNSQSEKPVVNPAKENRDDVVNEKGALVFSKTLNEILTDILPIYESAVKDNNPNKIKTVVYKNDTRKAINEAIRKYIFKDEAKQQIVKGELMMFSDNFQINRLLQISNATEVQVLKAEPVEDGDYKTFQVTFRDDENRMLTVSVLDEVDKQNHANDVSMLFAEAKRMPKGLARNDKLKEAWNLKRKFAPMDYAYAITSHKSQGSTYDNVIVHEGDIMSVGPTSPKEKSQSIYTALTRAKYSTIVVDGNRPANKENIKAALDLSDQKEKNPQILPSIPTVKEPPSAKAIPDKAMDYLKSKQDKDGNITVYRGVQGNGEQGTGQFWTTNRKVAEHYRDRYGIDNGAIKERKISLSEATKSFMGTEGNKGPAEGSDIFSLDPPPTPISQKQPEIMKPTITETVSKSFEPGDKEPMKGLANRKPEDKFREDVAAFYKEAAANPNTKYEIDYEFKGDRFRYKSGYTAKELANIFDAAGDIPENVHFSDSFQRLIANTSRRILDSLQIKPSELINRNEEAVIHQAGEILIPKRDAGGNLVGYFSAAEQQAIVDTALYATHSFLLKDPSFGANAIVKTFKGFEAYAKRDPNSNWAYIFDQRIKVAKEMLRNMEMLGYHVDPFSRKRILMAVDQLKDLNGLESKGLEEAQPDYETDVQDQGNGEFIEAMGHGLKDWGEVSFEHDPKDTASSRMKMFIAMQPDMDKGIYKAVNDPKSVQIDVPKGNLTEYYEKNPRDLKAIADQVNRKDFWAGDKTQELLKLLQTKHNILPKKNFLGLSKLVDFEATFQDILSTLADSPIHDYQTYTNTLINTGRPNLINLVQSLNGADQQVRNEFAKLVSMQYTNFSMLLFNRMEDINGTQYTLRPILSNRYSQRNTIIKNWREQMKISEIMRINDTGQRVIDTERAKNKWLPSLRILHKVEWGPDGDFAGQKQAKDFVKGILKVSGVIMTDDMIDTLFKKMEPLTRGTSVAGGVQKQFSITSDGKPGGMFSAFVMKMAGIHSANDIDGRMDSQTDIENRAEMNNPLYTENTTMQILAKVAAEHTPVLHSGSSRNSEGKDIWDYTMHNKLSHQMVDLKENYWQFRDRYLNVDIAKTNHLLATIERMPQYTEKMKLMYLDGMKPSWGKRGTTRSDMSDREQMLMSVALFQNQGNTFNSIPQANYFSLTHSDKTTTPLMMNMPRYDMGIDEIPREIIGRIGSVMYNIFKSEYTRIIKQADIDFNDARYNKGKNLFYFMPEFNKEAMKKMVDDGFLTDREFKTLWMNGENLSRSISKDVELPVINKILNKIAEDRIQTTIDAWTKQGIVNEQGHLFDKTYLARLTDKIGITRDQTYEEKVAGRPGSIVKRDGIDLPKEKADEITIRTAAKDYALNYFIHNVGMSQLFYGDPAMTFKAGAGDMASVDLTLKEYGKRLAKDIAPGLDPYFRPEDKKFTSITLADHNQAEKYLESLKNIYPNYRRVNATDAQELTTVREHLITSYANGEIPTKVFNDMMAIVEKNKGKYYEFTDPAHLAIIMQPKKPVYSAQRDSYQGAMLEDYVKTSSIPLYPPATAGLVVDALRTIMETRDIARAPFESGKKIGSPSKPAQFFDSEGQFKQPSEEEINGAIQQLDRSGFRIQQEVPYDEEKGSIKTVSQMNKLITEGIEDIQGFEVPHSDGLKSGAQIRQMKEDIRKNMIGLNYLNFTKSWGIVDNKISDLGRVYDRLVNMADEDNFTTNEIQGLLARGDKNDLYIPLMFNTGADKYEQMLMSMVKDIGQVKMPGKSFVQASSAGWTFKRESSVDQSKIVWAEHYDGSPLKTTRIDPATGKVLPAQVIIPFNFMGKDGIMKDVKDYMIMKEGRRIIDTTKIPKELTELIGARIPNQGHSSMSAMEIVGFIPKSMGDVIIVPAAFTKQMGADFDVDKLYTYRRPYYHNEEANTFHNDRTPDTMEQHQSDYFNVHWSVLTHPEMAERILKPLDKPDLKDENEVLQPAKSSTYNYFDHQSQLQDFQNGKDAKMLVALTSLSVTFNSVIQNKNLHYMSEDMILTPEGRYKKVQKKEYLTLKDEHTGDSLHLSNLSGNGKSTYTKQDGGAITSDSTRTKSDNHSTIQSAAVDNAKDRALDNLNITPHTYAAFDALNQLETEDGKALNLKYGTRLLTQPIIKEYAQEMKKGNDSLSQSFSRTLKQETIEKLRTKYHGEFGELDIFEEVENVQFDPQLLLKAQTMDPSSRDYAIHQLAALSLFEKADLIGERLSQLRSYFNQDTQGAGKNILTAMDKSDKLTKLNQAPIANAHEIYATGETLTEAGYTAAATTGVAVNILTQILPYDKYAGVFTELIAHSGRDSMSLDNQRDVLRAARSFTYNSGKHWWNDASAERGRLLYTQTDSLSLARRVEDAKRTWGKDNYFLQRLDSVIGDTKTSPDYLEYQAASAGRMDEANNTRAWTEMLMSKDEAQRRLGEDLLRYTYLTGGVQDSSSFVKFVPNAYIANTEFGNMLKVKGESLMRLSTEEQPVSVDMPGFISQFLQHYPERAFQVDRDTFPDIDAEQNYPESFKVLKDNTAHTKLIREDESYREFISYRSNTENKWILYHVNPASSGDIYYTRIDTLGNQFTDEYNGDVSSAVRSIFTDNRALADTLPAMSPLAKIQRLDNYYKGTSPYDELGVTEGKGQGHVNAILGRIADNERLPEAFRSVAKILLDIDPAITEANKTAREILRIPYDVVVKFDKDMGELATTSPKGELKFNPNAGDINLAAEAYLHEMVHHNLQMALRMSGYDRTMNEMIMDNKDQPESTKKVFRQMMADFEQKHPEVIKVARELDKIRMEAFTKLSHDMGEDFVNHTMEKIRGLEALNPKEKLLYAFQDVQEFVAHVLTDKDTQSYLNEIKAAGEGTFITKVWKAFTDLISSISKHIDRWVKKDSLLHQALYHTMTLTTSELTRSANIDNAMLRGETMHIPTESEARDTKDIIERTYNAKVDLNKDELGWYANAKLNDKPKVTLPVGKLKERLKKQLQSAYRDISKGTTEERVQARVRYNELRESYNEITRSPGESTIARLAEQQLKWVDKVIENKNANPATVQAAIDTANLWGSVQEIMYSEQVNPPTVDPTLAKLQADAINQRIKLINTNAVKVVTDAFDGRINLLPEDRKEELTEVPISQALFLTLARVKPKLISGIGMLTKTAADSRDEHMNRIHKQLLSIREKLTKNNLTAEHFMQKGTWALIDRLSNEWHQHLGELSDTRDRALEAIAKTEGIPENVAKERAQQAWQGYWNQVRKVGAFVDSRIFFDVDHGGKRTGSDVDAAYDRLIKSVGSKDYADELIQQAHDKYQKYIQERSIQADYLDGQIHLSEADKSGKTPEEQEKLRKEHVADELTKWLSWNSPHEFLNKMIGKGSTKFLNNGDRWVVMAPKADQKGFYDSRYDEVMGNKAVRPIFEEYKNLIQEMTSYLPPEHSEKLPPGFFPIVSNETVNSLSTMIGKLRNFDTTLMQMLTATEAEEYARMRPDEIPIMYTRETKWTKDEENRSKDLIRVAEVFSQMALHYRYMAPVLDQVNVAESVIKEANRQRVAGESEGPVLRNALDTIKYNKDKLIFNKPNELEGKIDNRVYSIINQAKQAKLQKEVKNLNKDKIQINKEISENLENGVYDNQDLEKKVEKIDERLTELEEQARYIYASKLADATISINQLKALAFNPFSAVSNFTFGMVSAHIHATGRVDYDPSHLGQAIGITTHAMKNYFTFGTAMDKTARKIRAVMERAQVMTEVANSNYIAKHDKNHLKEAISPYNWQKSGDYYTKSAMMIAMMLKKQIEVTDLNTGEKKMVNLWDSLGEDGKLDTTKYMDDANWFHEDVAQQKEWNHFRERIRGVATIVFGNQDKNSPLLAKKSMLWRLAGQFRLSWFPEGLNSRFGSERFDPLLGRDVKGRYRSFGTIGIFTSSIIMMRSLLDTLPGIHVDRFKGLADKEGNAIKDIDIENMRRNFAGLAWTATVTASILLLRAFDNGHKGKKKDDDDRKRQLIVNMLIRNQQDLMMYASPSVWDTVTGNLIPATNVITDTYKAMKATGHYLFGDTHKDKHAFQTWMLSITRATPILNNINKAEYMFNRDLDAIKR